MSWSAIIISAISGILPVFIIIRYNKDIVSIQSKIEKLYFGILPIVSVGTCIYVMFKNVVHLSTLEVCNRMIMFSLLWGIAYVDLKRNIIPNEFLITALIIRGIIFLIQLVVYGYDSVWEIMSEIFACLIVFCLCFIVRFLSKKGVGMGDIKLMTIIPLFYGAIGGLRALLYALIVVFVQCVFCLVTKRKGKKDVLAFGPAMAIGTWISLVITGY